MAETVAPTGISDNQMKTLIRGGWEDGDIRDTPEWGRWVKTADSDDIRQWLWVSSTPPHWVAYSNNEWTYVNSFEEALEFCDNLAGDNEVETPDGVATRQERRFARHAATATPDLT